jgi:hypothetical protein
MELPEPSTNLTEEAVKETIGVVLSQGNHLQLSAAASLGKTFSATKTVRVDPEEGSEDKEVFLMTSMLAFEGKEAMEKYDKFMKDTFGIEVDYE